MTISGLKQILDKAELVLGADGTVFIQTIDRAGDTDYLELTTWEIREYWVLIS